MAEHFLDMAQISAVADQMSGKAVPEGMGRDAFGDLRALYIFIHEFTQRVFT